VEDFSGDAEVPSDQNKSGKHRSVIAVQVLVINLQFYNSFVPVHRGGQVIFIWSFYSSLPLFSPRFIAPTPDVSCNPVSALYVSGPRSGAAVRRTRLPWDDFVEPFPFQGLQGRKRRGTVLSGRALPSGSGVDGVGWGKSLSLTMGGSGELLTRRV